MNRTSTLHREDRVPLPGGGSLPLAELRFEFSRSSGPGGQNVNKVSTRVTLLFDLNASPSLSEARKQAIRAALAGRISQEGVLRVVSSKHRTQSANRAAAVGRFAELLAAALTPRRKRKKTAVPARSHARRLNEKTRRGQKKNSRADARMDREE